MNARPSLRVIEGGRPPDDPIFASIEAHKTKYAAFHAGIKARLDDEVTGGLLDEEGYELADLLGTKPTTLAGCVALLRYLGAYCDKEDHAMFQNCIDPLASAGRDFLPMIADMLEALAAQSGE